MEDTTKNMIDLTSKEGQEFLRKFSETIVAETMSKLAKSDIESLRQLDEIQQNHKERYNEKIQKFEQRTNDSKEISKTAREPINQTIQAVKSFGNDLGNEVKGYATQIKENIHDFWNSTKEKLQQASKEAADKTKEFGHDAGKAIASKFGKDFISTAIIAKEYQLIPANQILQSNKRELARLEKLKQRLDKVNERVIIAKSVFVRNPAEYREKSMEALKNSKGFLSEMIEDTKREISSSEKNVNQIKETIRDLEVTKSKNRETLDQIINKYKKETEKERANDRTKEKTGPEKTDRSGDR